MTVEHVNGNTFDFGVCGSNLIEVTRPENSKRRHDRQNGRGEYAEPLAPLRNILSVFDYSGRWSKPYRENGYNVIQIDIKLGDDVRLLEWIPLPIYGILLAPPCTDFSLSGAQYWPAKDANRSTHASIALVDAGLRLVAIYNPVFWALENPRGRIDRWLGPPRMEFNPCDYGDPYTKKTRLWGNFNPPFKTNRVEPERVCSQGSWIQKLGGKSERTKELRSMTPANFAQAFFNANR